MSRSVMQNRIAAYETHKETLRSGPPGKHADSPNLSSVRSEASNRKFTSGLLFRAERFQQQQQQQYNNQNSKNKNNDPPASTMTTNSMIELRRARQQRKKGIRGANTKNNDNEENDSNVVSGRLQPQHQQQRQQQPNYYNNNNNNNHCSIPARVSCSSPDSILTSGRRLVHTASNESTARYSRDEDYKDGDDEEAGNLRQIQEAFPQANLQQLMRSPTKPQQESNYDPGADLVHDDDEDEQTLTSVRQIMNTPDGRILRSASSSSSKHQHHQHQQQLYEEIQRSTSSAMGLTEGIGAMFPMPRHDDDTFAEDFNGDDVSVSYEQQKSMEREKARDDGYQEEVDSPLLNKEDFEHFGKSLNNPVAKTAVGVAAAATVGTMLLGPVGLLVGAASVGISIGVMQIPEEQRANVKEKATAALKRTHERVIDASESFTSMCAATLEEAGVVEQIPKEMKRCLAPNPDKADDFVTDGAQGSAKGGAGEEEHNRVSQSPVKASGEDRQSVSPKVGSRNRRVACLRNVRIVPVSQIHGLEPSKQPRAWLDVMASAQTTMEEKNEAMEEILISAKDKRNARMLLDEGILDSLLYIVMRYWDEPSAQTRAHAHAKLAANCLLILGKAHCAAVHTGGDLMLMSLYEHGRVPEERQLAQMLYEVSHHVLGKEGSDLFILRQPSMTQAEDISVKTKQLADS